MCFLCTLKIVVLKLVWSSSCEIPMISVDNMFFSRCDNPLDGCKRLGNHAQQYASYYSFTAGIIAMVRHSLLVETYIKPSRKTLKGFAWPFMEPNQFLLVISEVCPAH